MCLFCFVFEIWFPEKTILTCNIHLWECLYYVDSKVMEPRTNHSSGLRERPTLHSARLLPCNHSPTPPPQFLIMLIGTRGLGCTKRRLRKWNRITRFHSLSHPKKVAPRCSACCAVSDSKWFKEEELAWVVQSPVEKVIGTKERRASGKVWGSRVLQYFLGQDTEAQNS